MADLGTITFVFQDDVSFTASLTARLNLLVQVGGLEVQNPHTQDYIPAVPIVSEIFLCGRSRIDPFHESLVPLSSMSATSWRGGLMTCSEGDHASQIHDLGSL